MARTKQTPRKSTGGKAPRKQFATPARRPKDISICMIRNHCGPFPLSKSINSNINNNQKTTNEEIM